MDFGKERYDLAILGNICHSQGAEATKRLFKKVYRSLRSKGKIIVIDTLPNEERTGPVFPLIFAALMLLSTPEGDTFTFGQFKEWLIEAGFNQIERFDLSEYTSVVTAGK